MSIGLGSSGEPLAGPLPPFARMADFLPAMQHQLLLEWIIDNRDRFQPATVTHGRKGSYLRSDSSVRQALTFHDVGPMKAELSERLLEALPKLMSQAGLKGSEPRSLELELAAYGDGAHFAAHLDIPIGADRAALGPRPGEDRILSAVYYLHSLPKKFSGGALRLHRFGVQTPEQSRPGVECVDVEPVENSLVAFPSWVTHEVRPVSCPSGEFEDYRFSLNCWYCRTLG